MMVMGKLNSMNMNETVSNIATILVVCIDALAPMRRESRDGDVGSARRRRDKKPTPTPLPPPPLSVTDPALAVDMDVAVDLGVFLTEMSKPRSPRMIQMLQMRRMRLGITRTEMTAEEEEEEEGVEKDVRKTDD